MERRGIDLSEAVMHIVSRSSAEDLEVFASAGLPERRDVADRVFEAARAAYAAAGSPFSCRGAGCAGCCRGEVATGSVEFADLVPALSGEVFARALALRGADPQTAVCPVLDPETRTCSAWERRPLICRAYNAVTPAEWCDPANGEREVASALGPLAIVGTFVALNRDYAIDAPFGGPRPLLELLIEHASELPEVR